MTLSGKRILIYGMQSSGISAAYLAKREGAKVLCYDDDPSVQVADFTFLRQELSADILRSFDLAVVSPSLAKYHPFFALAQQASLPVMGELEFGTSFLHCKMVAITGTNGKTTCTTMVEKLLQIAGFRAKAMGNIGYPISQIVLDNTPLDIAVIEVSSFQLEHAPTFHPDVAVILNLAPDHLDRYNDYHDYVETKKKILKNLTEKDYYVFGSDDGVLRSFVKNCRAKAIPISTRNTLAEVCVKGSYFVYGEQSIAHVKECRARGEHNRFNMLVAMNVGKIFGVRKEHMAKLVRDYSFLPNRIEYVTTIAGKNYYNDSKGTNVHACRNAVAAMEGTVGLIMGGSDKNEDYCDFFDTLDDKVKCVAITGGNAEKIYNSAQKMGYCEAYVFSDLNECVSFLSQKNVDNVLLSPCSASFDRYKNYAERGQRFKEIVYAIKV